MTREHRFGKRAPADPVFRWRGVDLSRLEGLNDAAFAIRVALRSTSGTGH